MKKHTFNDVQYAKGSRDAIGKALTCKTLDILRKQDDDFVTTTNEMMELVMKSLTNTELEKLRSHYPMLSYVDSVTPVVNRAVKRALMCDEMGFESFPRRQSGGERFWTRNPTSEHFDWRASQKEKLSKNVAKGAARDRVAAQAKRDDEGLGPLRIAA